MNVIVKLAILFVLACFPAAVGAHELHRGAQNVNYSNWKNSKASPQGCCNNQDCRPVEDRSVGDHQEVKVEGKWCVVHPWMYLSTGNAPDWSTAHACVEVQTGEGYEMTPNSADPCQRLICYQPKPGG